jgi:extracellular factor (EF) 3-hydroxypalmitic acid methyl ester biosynthesis protein
LEPESLGIIVENIHRIFMGRVLSDCATIAQQDQGRSVSMGRGALEYLSASDWNLVASKSKKISFDKDQTLIREGSAAKTIYILRSGKVRVERSNGAGRAVLVTLGPGAIVGEMAFIEDGLASASVVAEGNVEVDALEVPDLKQMFEAFPHFGARFYRSVAVTLSQRLRETSGLLARAKTNSK